jgi:A/G-specific adenine glycosylase
MKRLEQEGIKGIQSRLLGWFKENQRPLPWRENYDPYQVWISEIMLQQTQVKTVLPYFKRWMKALPDIQSVAEAGEDAILKLWEGLGYYSRARNIQKAARQIMSEHGGIFPSGYDDILALPGVGKYTAGAIASIAFNQDYPLVDGNVVRVLSRLFLYSKNTRSPEAEKQMWRWAEELLSKGRARYFNQAMMEFGALQCTPASPDCESCPLNSRCGAYEKGLVDILPDRGPKKELKHIKVAVAVIRKDGKIFIQKRPPTGLMAGLWEFPGGKVERGESAVAALHREIKEECGIIVKNVKNIRRIRHAYTSFKVDLHCFEADFSSGRVRLNAASEGRWVKVGDLGKYPFPAANVELIAYLD